MRSQSFANCCYWPRPSSLSTWLGVYSPYQQHFSSLWSTTSSGSLSRLLRQRNNSGRAIFASNQSFSSRGELGHTGWHGVVASPRDALLSHATIAEASSSWKTHQLFSELRMKIERSFSLFLLSRFTLEHSVRETNLFLLSSSLHRIGFLVILSCCCSVGWA